MLSPSSAFVAELDPTTYESHTLHDAARDWPQTNCYADLWIEAIAARGGDPRAMFGFAAALDFEGDQFTFFKPSLDEIELLYGLGVFELSIYDNLAGHIAAQCARGRLVMVEVDAFYLADTRGVSYQLEHSKTTIGVNTLDLERRRADFFHNEGYFRAEGEDFAQLFRLTPKAADDLPPYAEFVRPLAAPLAPDAARLAARKLLLRHLARRPRANPIAAFAAALPDLMAAARAKDPAFFHKFAFNTLRQLGANFELLADHLAWLGGDHGRAIASARALSAGAKAQQFMMARAMMRNKPLEIDSAFGDLARVYAELFDALDTSCAALSHAH